MSYLRVKWIKGNPYLYEQASYRVGNKVKTRHIRYVGRYGHAGHSGGYGTSGFTAPAGLTPERKRYVDREIRRLQFGDAFPFEREILRQYVYPQAYRLRFNSRSKTAAGYVTRNTNIYSGESTILNLGLRSNSKPFTWLHEIGHLLEYADGLVDNEIRHLRREFASQVYDSYQTAVQLPLNVDHVETFIHKYGALIDMRDDETKETTRILARLEQVKSGALEAEQFMRMFTLWTRISYRLTPSELFADSVASLILNPKTAFSAHGEHGRKYLTRVWIVLVKHFEDTYHLSLQRPKKIHRRL